MDSLTVYSASNGNWLRNVSYGGPFGGCCALGYSLLVNVNGDTCVELVVRGEYSAPILNVYRSSNIGSCYMSYDDPVNVEEREKPYVSFEVVRGGIRFFEAAGAEIYSVDGARIMVVSKPGFVRLKEGIYLVKQGGKISKVVIK